MIKDGWTSCIPTWLKELSFPGPSFSDPEFTIPPPILIQLTKFPYSKYDKCLIS